MIFDIVMEKMMEYKAPRGTHDIWGKQAEALQRLEDASRSVFQRYNFGEIRVPTFEDANLFVRSIGETTDIVEKEMYVFEDRKGRKLALRPEGTASVVRAYVENQLSKDVPVNKFFYMGSMYRYERPQAGRYREFHQIGAEYFSNPSPIADADIILLTKDILNAAGLKEIKVHIHTLGCDICRPSFRKALTDCLASKKDLCADCTMRLERNPLRVLDCKVDGPKLDNLPKMTDFLCDECRAHFDSVKKFLLSAKCEFYEDSRLVRGLDYYTRTIFEIRSSYLGSQDALAAGGRYDNLVKELGGKPTPAVGFALGSERVAMAIEKMNIQSDSANLEKIFIAVQDKQFEDEAFRIAVKLRALLPSVQLWQSLFAGAQTISVEGPFAEKSLKSQLRVADRFGASKVIIIGEQELKRGAIILKNMKSQSQEEIKLDLFK